MTIDTEHALADPERVAALRRLDLLDTGSEESFDRLTRLAARALRVPVALVVLSDDRRQYFKSHVGLPEPWASAREYPIRKCCGALVVASGAPVVVEDARTHRVARHYRIVDDLGVAGYAGVPLRTADGQVIGSFCALDAAPRSWSPEDVRTLEDLAAVAMAEVELRATGREARRRAEESDRERETRLELLAAARRAEALEMGQRQVLELIATGRPLPEVLEALARVIEEQGDGLLCSVLLHDGREKCLRSGAAPSLPPSYCSAIDGVPVFPYVGPCGKAAHERAQVISADLALDRRWTEEFRGLALAHDLRACWSTPIVASTGDVLGTFAMYYREPRGPGEREQQLIDAATHLAGIAIERDRTEAALRQSEASYRGLVDNLPGVVYRCANDPEWTLHYASDAIRDITGYPASDFIGNAVRSVASVVHPDDRAAVAASVNDAVARREPFSLEYRMVHADGTVRWVHERGRAIFAESGEVLWLDGVLLDITQRKAFEEERERLLAQEQAARVAAEEALQLRDEFLSIAAHELKTPLTGLWSAAQLALRRLEHDSTLEPARLRDNLGAVEGQARKLSRLVNQLLDVSRLQLGRLALDRRPTDLRQLVLEVVAAARDRGAAHEIVVQDRGDAVVAAVDPLRLEQVLVNLLDNALKYSPADRPVEVGIALAPAGERAVQLAVRDRGAGIAPERRPRLFERFYQAHAAAHQSGMGLGLYITRQIVELHRGTITAEFPDDGGMRLVITLPLDP